MLFDALVAGNIRENATRCAITVLIIALGTTVAFAVALLNTVTISAISAGADQLDESVNLLVVGGPRGFDERVLSILRVQDGVISAAPRTEDSMRIPQGSGGSYELLRLVGVDSLETLPREAEFRTTLQGPYSDPNSQAGVMLYDRGVFVSPEVAQRLSLRIGSKLSGFSGSKKVSLSLAGILPITFSGFDANVAFIDIATAQALFGKGGKLDRIDCVISPQMLPTIQKRIDELLPRGVHAVRPQDNVADVRPLVQGFRTDLTILEYVAIAVASCLVFSAVAISVLERKMEIGTLRALGAHRWKIFRTFLYEGATFGILGCFVGTILGALVAQYLGSDPRNGSIAPVFDFAAVTRAFFLGVLVTTSSAIVPALMAGRVSPAISMRARGYESRSTGLPAWTFAAGSLFLILAAVAWAVPGLPSAGLVQAVSIGSLLLGAALYSPTITVTVSRLAPRAVRRLPLTAKLAATMLAWSPLRMAVAVAALAVSIALSAGASISGASLENAVGAWASTAYPATLYIRPIDSSDPETSNFPPQIVRRLALPSVSSVIAERHVRVRIGSSYVTVIGKDDESRSAGRVAMAPQARVSNALLASLHLRVGDHIVIPGSKFPVTFHVESSYEDYSNDPESITMDRRLFSSVFNDPTIDSIAVYARRRADVEDLRRRIELELQSLAISVVANDELRAEAVHVFDKPFAIERMLGGIVIGNALFGIMATMLAIVLERQDEIRTLRRLGAAIGLLTKAIVLQSCVIGILSCALGLAIGAALAASLVFGVDAGTYGGHSAWKLPLSNLLALTAAIACCSAIAGLYPARFVSRLPSLASAAREN